MLSSLLLQADQKSTPTINKQKTYKPMAIGLSFAHLRAQREANFLTKMRYTGTHETP